ncbi:hypothetical protein DPEC_G00182510 [Dallia pectoralis]|uniref:Uncharacterized protein n=1 Tax=Dallia pectoralis TaxID=75939 RepID=A0ACC2GAC4_DALPE|nr:hypothetical protein DPEC_G00182510 [Dallia pectoralis]
MTLRVMADSRHVAEAEDQLGGSSVSGHELGRLNIQETNKSSAQTTATETKRNGPVSGTGDKGVHWAEPDFRPLKPFVRDGEKPSASHLVIHFFTLLFIMLSKLITAKGG